MKRLRIGQIFTDPKGPRELQHPDTTKLSLSAGTWTLDRASWVRPEYSCPDPGQVLGSRQCRHVAVDVAVSCSPVRLDLCEVSEAPESKQGGFEAGGDDAVVGV
ncbi:hypothetical protein GCM10023094_25230 [Rhodococcus olei]|uniref:Uncharacterized protein n=1 Tax=Rhodococcus olei TaxID=2161675 RepID=A0ABP8P121_9NOCA